MDIVRLGMQPYQEIWQKMKVLTQTRTAEDADQIWILEHPPVYTQGQAGKAEHILNPSNIPVINTDRGGQVTYHGPGQLVAYFLIDLRRMKLGIRDLVCQLENMLIAFLNQYHIEAHTICGAPGVYVNDNKIASIGLRVKNGCTYHGIALNVDMDLSPFNGINPCGFEALKMTQMRDLSSQISLPNVELQFMDCCRERFVN